MNYFETYSQLPWSSPLSRRCLFYFGLIITTLIAQSVNANQDGHQRRPIPDPEVLKRLPPDGGAEFNRLVFEKSPYLLQHAANPVDWYPWSQVAFERAKKEDKPIFLSIGYTTCHWCHVMERESFEDQEVADLLNKYFICIKVDREERPDIDQVYMTVTQAMTGSGGWPMTVVMTPEKKPYFAGTYFPKKGRLGRAGLMEMLPTLGQAWQAQRPKVVEVSDQIIDTLKQLTAGTPGKNLDGEMLDNAFQQLNSRYDSARGGFSQTRKFPVPHNLMFLLRYWKRTGKPKALRMVEKTLVEMRLGGMYDHLGFGTHRYSSDPEWVAPHFEKMLYDQSLLAMANIEAWQATGQEFYAVTAREIFTYVLRDMTSAEGGFYSAEDADSEGEEGKFYLWTPAEVINILGLEEGQFFNQVFNIVEKGNFKEEASGKNTGRSIVHLQQIPSEIATELKISETNLRNRIKPLRNQLFQVRKKRIRPQKDDKILTDWNGLMIASLAMGGRILAEPEYTKAATKAADFVLNQLRQENGRLLKRYRQGEAGLPAHLEDYAFMVWGLIELYQSNLDLYYLEQAIELNELMLKHFWDQQNGGLFLTADDSEKLLVRSKEIYDGAIPSGNSVATLNLLRLGRMTARIDYLHKADEVFKAFSGSVAQGPSGHSFLMMALEFARDSSFEVVITGSSENRDVQQMIAALWRPFLPNKVVLFRPEEEDIRLTQLAPYTENQVPSERRATAYVCRNFSCQQPTTKIDKMLGLLGIEEESSLIGD